MVAISKKERITKRGEGRERREEGREGKGSRERKEQECRQAKTVCVRAGIPTVRCCEQQEFHWLRPVTDIF